MKENHDIICQFVAWHQSAGHSDKTITYYLQAIDSLMFFRCRYFDEYTSLDMIDYQRWLLSDLPHAVADRVLPSKLSRATVRTYVKALRTFFTWLVHHHFIAASPFDDVPIPKKHYKLIRILTDDEICKLRNYLDDNILERGIFAIELMLSCGLRASEVCNLTYDDFDIVSGNDLGIRVLGKGSKERYVFLDRTILDLYQIYEVPQMVKDFIDAKFTYNRLSNLIKFISEDISIPRLTCHLLRHTFATRYLIDGGDSLQLKYILGHSSLDMVDHYVHLAHMYRRT